MKNINKALMHLHRRCPASFYRVYIHMKVDRSMSGPVKNEVARLLATISEPSKLIKSLRNDCMGTVAIVCPLCNYRSDDERHFSTKRSSVEHRGHYQRLKQNDPRHTFCTRARDPELSALVGFANKFTCPSDSKGWYMCRLDGKVYRELKQL